MANAGCINAYDCNGCLIQTLQNLDSACIGVGVQYTAPNPLDDKRLDYIKYTDKCGCVQCLSAENEILIYATNGVIKNLTLTNDDVNEAIKIKWNDIFGSNRAKTIVRYKTGSYPVSITDGTLAVEETTKNQYSSTPFSLSGVLDETTYYITAFAVDSNNVVIGTQQTTITTSFGWHPSANTLARYKFEGNLNDSSGNNRNLTNSGTISYSSSPMSVNLTSSSYLYKSNFSNFAFNRTFNCWVKITARNSSSSILFSTPHGSSRHDVILVGIDKNGHLVMTDYGGDYTGTKVYNLNEWYNVCVAYDYVNKKCYGYVNGVLDGINSIMNYTLYDSRLNIGMNNWESPTSVSALQGKLSNTFFESKFWTAQESQEYYNKTKSKYGY